MPRTFAGIIATVAVIAAAAMSFAGQLPQTGVNGSFHDITYLGVTGGYYNQDDYQRVCIFCHTPHNAQSGAAGAGIPTPLWNHLPSPANLPAYAWAAPANLPIGFPAGDPLVGPSRLCMACHDGVTAVDNHGPYTAGQTAQGGNNGNHALVNPSRSITDLTVTHPIGFLYSDALTLRTTEELVDPSTGAFFVDRVLEDAAAAGNNSKVGQRAGWTYTNKPISDTLYQGFVTCASCHEVHNLRNSANDPSVSNPGFTPNYFVWAREKGSALCLSCHVK
jgi:hypothetical protein